jgi:hypothetical protein
VLAAAGEVGLLAAAITDWPPFFPEGLAFLVFLVGPPAFLSVVAWRRRAHPARSRFLFVVAVVVAVVGLATSVIHLTADTETRRGNWLLNPAVVPLAQWLVVLAAWLRVTAAESREKRRR